MDPTPSVSAETDPDLPAIERVLAGDPQAFGEIVQRHEASLRRLLLGIVADADQAEDVLQDSFLIAYRQLGSFKGKSRFKTWLSRITVREGMRARSKLRRLWSVVTPSEEAGQDSADAAEVSVGSAIEDREEARVWLAHLPVKERTAFVLFAEGWSHQEIADSMGCPMGTVACWIHRAKSRLSKALELKQQQEGALRDPSFRRAAAANLNELPAREGIR